MSLIDGFGLYFDAHTCSMDKPNMSQVSSPNLLLRWTLSFTLVKELAILIFGVKLKFISSQSTTSCYTHINKGDCIKRMEASSSTS